MPTTWVPAVGRIGPETRDPVDEVDYFQTPGRAKMTSVPRPPVVSEDGIINRKGAVDQHVLKEFIMESEQDLDVGLEAEMADDNDDADADDDQDARARIGAMAPGFFKSMKRTASAKMLNDVFSVDGAAAPGSPGSGASAATPKGARKAEPTEPMAGARGKYAKLIGPNHHDAFAPERRNLLFRRPKRPVHGAPDLRARAPLPTLLADRAEPARSPALARARARAGTKISRYLHRAPRADASALDKLRHRVARFVKGDVVETIIRALLLANFIVLGFEADRLDQPQENADDDDPQQSAERTLFAFWSVESPESPRLASDRSGIYI